MLSFRTLQEELTAWSKRNFPDQKNYQCLLGLVEEVGELSHAHLKAEQKIRMEENHEEKRKDAIGDIVIYLAGYCNAYGLDLGMCVETAWNEVKQRDWIKAKQIEDAPQKTVKPGICRGVACNSKVLKKDYFTLKESE